MIDPKRGEVWWVDFDPPKGEEMRKTRPAVVVGSEYIGRPTLRILVPLTSTIPNGPCPLWMIIVDKSKRNGLHNHSTADCSQVKSVSLVRFKEKLGALTDQQMQQIAAAIALCVDYQ